MPRTNLRLQTWPNTNYTDYTYESQLPLNYNLNETRQLSVLIKIIEKDTQMIFGRLLQSCNGSKSATEGQADRLCSL